VSPIDQDFTKPVRPRNTDLGADCLDLNLGKWYYRHNINRSRIFV
jgi:hypothetical protein